MIRKRKDGYYVVSEKKKADGSPARVEGPYKTRTAAAERLRQWEAAKAAKGKK